MPSARRGCRPAGSLAIRRQRSPRRSSASDGERCTGGSAETERQPPSDFRRAAPSSRGSTRMLRPALRSVTAPDAATFSMKSRKLPAPYSRSENVESSCSSVLFKQTELWCQLAIRQHFKSPRTSGSASAIGVVPVDDLAPRPAGSTATCPARFSYAMNS